MWKETEKEYLYRTAWQTCSAGLFVWYEKDNNFICSLVVPPVATDSKKNLSTEFKDWSSNSHVALIVPYSLAYFDGLHQTSQTEHITFLCAHTLKGTPPKIQNPLCKKSLQVHSELYQLYLVTPHVVCRDCVCVKLIYCFTMNTVFIWTQRRH